MSTSIGERHYPASPPKKIAFLGMGVMGYPMAGHLSRAGHSITVYNRSTEKATAWLREFHGQHAQTPADAARNADFVVACVGNDDDLRSVVLGDSGAFEGMKAGAIFIDHTTASANVARELNAIARSRELDFVDAPVSGGQAGAVNGALTVMCGAHPETFDLAEPIISNYAQAITLMGDSGSGQLCKMVNQICIAGLLQGLSEAIAFGKTAGLDMHKALAVIGKGAAQSWQLDHRGTTMIDNKFDFGFAVDWMRKDLGLVLEEAKNNGSSVPVTALVDQFYADVQRFGGGRWDTSSLITRLQK